MCFYLMTFIFNVFTKKMWSKFANVTPASNIKTRLPITWFIDIMRQKLKCTQGKEIFSITLVHEFTIPVPVLLLPVFWQLLLRNEKFRANLCFETSEHSVQTADDNRKVISPTLVLYIFKLVLYFN